MLIFVNDHKLDINLEKEKTVGEVYQGVSKWVETNGKYVVSCFADGKDYGTSEMGELGFHDVKRLDFIIGEEIDVLQSSLEELDRYVDSIGSTLIGRDSLTENETRDLSEGIIWIDSILSSAKKLLKLKLNTIRPMGKGKNVEEILETLHKTVTHLESVTAIDTFLEDLRDLKLFILDLRNRTAILDLDNDKLLDIVKEYTFNLDKIKSEFRQINENFQSGKDHIGSEFLSNSVNKLNTLLTALISLRNSYPHLNLETVKVGDQELASFNKGMNECLSHIALALEKGDIVLAGDILEYELPELLDGFHPFLERIIELVETPVS
ncbi:hypothetical protein [Leptospira sp. GIMC2001]|uniref:hypothetical protein n=1 Tax=Leptospira sp. GIMC2001 TaxID=1513297 RepID=UPI00234AF2AC|nr:hypothetical protein [Leptospira sp. GIMC2001]WCL48801.1 hypothetical protein O4O04_16055 [Leptospira sp. GIMC2001]